MPQIPAHIFWPGLIITFLLFSVGSSTAILLAAHSDEGPQVIPDYYARSVNFDQEQEGRYEARDLGWTLDITLDAPNAGRGELHILDQDGDAVENLEGTIGFGRPSLAEETERARLTPDDERPGIYLFPNLADTSGLWDLGVELDKDNKSYGWTIRVTAQ
jgi:nitrogen fixation protein FixH